MPLNDTVAEGLTLAAVTVSTPASAPRDWGVNTTPVVQAAPDARLVPQLFCDRLNGPVTVRERLFAVVPPRFEIVTTWAAPALYNACAGNESWAGFTPSPAALWPIPVSDTATGDTPVVDDEMVRVAAAPPAVAGVKITCTAQLAPASRVAPQVEFAVEKLAAAGPVIWNPGFARAAPPLLVTLMEAGAPATPTGCAGKLRLAALAESAGGNRPVPLRETVCFAFSASEMESAP